MKNQRQRKNEISDALTLAAGKIALTLLLLIAAVGLPLYGLHQLAGQFEYSALRWIAVGLALAIPAAAALGFRMGRYEVQGFLGGFDKGLTGLAQAVDLRDNSKVRLQAAAAATRAAQPNPAQPDINVYLPPAGALPTITHRQLTQDGLVEL